MGYSIDIGAGNNAPVPPLQPASANVASGRAGGQVASEQSSADTIGGVVAGGVQDGITVVYDPIDKTVDFTNTDKGSVAVTSHVADTDPHGDRAYADAQDAAHVAAADPHPVYPLFHEPLASHPDLPANYRIGMYEYATAAAGEGALAVTGGIIFVMMAPGVGTTVSEAYGFFSTGDGGGTVNNVAYYAECTGTGAYGFYQGGAAQNYFNGVTTFNNTVILRAGTTSVPSLRIPHGSAPTSPTNGDVWTTTAGIYVRIDGATVGPLGTGGGGGLTSAEVRRRIFLGV